MLTLATIVSTKKYNKAESPLPPHVTTNISPPPSLPRTSSENVDKYNEK